MQEAVLTPRRRFHTTGFRCLVVTTLCGTTQKLWSPRRCSPTACVKSVCDASSVCLTALALNSLISHLAGRAAAAPANALIPGAAAQPQPAAAGATTVVLVARRLCAMVCPARICELALLPQSRNTERCPGYDGLINSAQMRICSAAVIAPPAAAAVPTNFVRHLPDVMFAIKLLASVCVAPLRSTPFLTKHDHRSVCAGSERLLCVGCRGGHPAALHRLRLVRSALHGCV